MASPERASEATLHELLDALADKGDPALPDCPLCRLVRRSVERSLRVFFAEFVNDPQVRLSFRSAGGFCPAHTPLLASLGDALAVAILYHDLADQARTRWESKRGGEGTRLPWPRSRRATPTVPCPACSAAEDASARYAAALAAGLEDPALWQRLESGTGLCVAHVEEILARAKPAAAARLREAESARLATLQAELAEIIRKNDYRFRGEPWGEEKDAWLRALQKITRPRT